MKKKDKKLYKRIFDALTLGEKLQLSTNRGIVDQTPNKKATKKQRRHMGWKTPRFADKTKYSEAIQEALEPQLMYDEWRTHRDGFRDVKDKTKLTSEMGHYWGFSREEIRVKNNRIKKQIAIRKAKKTIRKIYKL